MPIGNPYSPKTIYGLAIANGAKCADNHGTFDASSLADLPRQLPKLKLLRDHDKDRELARYDDGSLVAKWTRYGLLFAASVVDTPAGDRALRDVSSGRLMGVSVGYHSSTSGVLKWGQFTSLNRDVRVHEISLLGSGANPATAAIVGDNWRNVVMGLRSTGDLRERMRVLKSKASWWDHDVANWNSYLRELNLHRLCAFAAENEGRAELDLSDDVLSRHLLTAAESY